VIKEADAFKRLLISYAGSDQWSPEAGLERAVNTTQDDRRGERGGACDVDLVETDGGLMGAYLVRIAAVQQAAADTTGAFARQARKLKPVQLVLGDTEESCCIAASPRVACGEHDGWAPGPRG